MYSYKTKPPLEVKRNEVHKVIHPDALPLYCRKLGLRLTFELSSWMYVLIVDELPLEDSVVNEDFDIRRDVPFSLRAMLRVKIRPAEYQRSSGRYGVIEPEITKSIYESIPALSASVVEYERKVTEVVDDVIGAAKQLANDVMASQRSMLAEHLADKGVFQFTDTKTGEKLSPDAVADKYLGTEDFSISDAERAGADTVKNMPAYGTVLLAAEIATTKGKSVLKDIDELVEKAVKNSRSVTEAIGKAGMEEAKKRLEMVTDNRYIDRYHGPDDIARDKDGKLTEIEAKGTNSGSTNVAKNSKLEMQGSAAKNLRRAKQMSDKSKKVGQPSNRQGGAYTQDELDLWRFIEDRDGNKRHISTHTHTDLGIVTVIERDKKGKIIQEIDGFTIDNFDAVKRGIEGRLKK